MDFGRKLTEQITASLKDVPYAILSDGVCTYLFIDGVLQRGVTNMDFHAALEESSTLSVDYTCLPPV